MKKGLGNEGNGEKKRELLRLTTDWGGGSRWTCPLRSDTSRVCLVGYLAPAVELANGYDDTTERTERTSTDAKT
jgi:hypothetical protein